MSESNFDKTRPLTRTEAAYVYGTLPLTKPIPKGVADRATRRRSSSGTVHEMAALGVDYMCGRVAEEPFKWTTLPVTCKGCLRAWRPRVERAAHGMSGETVCVPTLVGARKRGVHATPTTRQILSGYRCAK